jgi:hypothetical protein
VPRQLDVLEHREHRDQVEALEDEADGVQAQVGEHPLGERAGVLAGDLDDAGSRGVDAADEVEQGGLAAAGGARHREELALADLQVDAAEGRDQHVAECVLLHSAADRND